MVKSIFVWQTTVVDAYVAIDTKLTTKVGESVNLATGCHFFN
jgi:hypothetical protein